MLRSFYFLVYINTKICIYMFHLLSPAEYLAPRFSLVLYWSTVQCGYQMSHCQRHLYFTCLSTTVLFLFLFSLLIQQTKSNSYLITASSWYHHFKAPYSQQNRYLSKESAVRHTPSAVYSSQSVPMSVVCTLPQEKNQRRYLQ